MTQTTGTLLDQLRDERGLTNEERFHLLIDAADRTLLADIVADNLNPLEKRIILALAVLDWPEGEPLATDLAFVLKERAGPRANPSTKVRELDVATQLGHLDRKEWVRGVERDDGTLSWELA